MKCYGENGTGGTPALLGKRKETGRLKRFTYGNIVARDKADLDMLPPPDSASLRLWPKGDSLGDSGNLPPPAELAAEIVEGLEAALEEFRAVEKALLSSHNWLFREAGPRCGTR